MEDKPYWEVKRDGVRVAYGCQETFPGREERKLLRAGGHKIYKNGKIFKEWADVKSYCDYGAAGA